MGNNPANFTDPTGGFTGQTSHQQYGAGGTGQTGSGQSFNNSSNSTKGKPRCPKPGKTYENGKAGGKHKNNSNPNGGPSSQNGGGNGLGNSGTQPMDGQANAPSSGGGGDNSSGDEAGCSGSICIIDSRNVPSSGDYDINDDPLYNTNYTSWEIIDLAKTDPDGGYSGADSYIKENYNDIKNTIFITHGRRANNRKGEVNLNKSDGWKTAQNLDSSFDGLITTIDSKMSNTGQPMTGSDQTGYILVLGCRTGDTGIDSRIKLSANTSKIVLTHWGQAFITRHGSSNLNPVIGGFWSSTLRTRTPISGIGLSPGHFNFSINKSGRVRLGIGLTSFGLINISIVNP